MHVCVVNLHGENSHKLGIIRKVITLNGTFATFVFGLLRIRLSLLGFGVFGHVSVSTQMCNDITLLLAMCQKARKHIRVWRF